MNHRPLVFIDVETSGGRRENSRIIDIGLIRVENGKIVAMMNQLIHPNQNIPYFITELTGITNEMLWDKPNFESIAPQIEVLCKDALFIAHNVNFDYSHIKREFKNIGVKFNMDRACSVKLSRLNDPIFVRHSLDKIIERMSMSVENRHRGYDDAEVLWKYFQQSYKRLGNELFLNLKMVTTFSRKAAVENPRQVKFIL